MAVKLIKRKFRTWEECLQLRELKSLKVLGLRLCPVFVLWPWVLVFVFVFVSLLTLELRELKQKVLGPGFGSFVVGLILV